MCPSYDGEPLSSKLLFSRSPDSTGLHATEIMIMKKGLSTLLKSTVVQAALTLLAIILYIGLIFVAVQFTGATQVLY